MGDPRSEPMRVLYITYDGLLEPLGRSQVLGYVTRLGQTGMRIAILSFEKPLDLRDDRRRRELETALAGNGISWMPLVYHRSPSLPATIWDVVKGSCKAVLLARRFGAQIVHARSYVAGLIGLSVKAVLGLPFLFDMRGFWPEERVEMGLCRPMGLVYRTSKLVERKLLARADHVVVLTETAKSILRDREAQATLESSMVREQAITVVPCCVDLEGFSPMPKDQDLARGFGLENSLVIGNIGAFSPRYLTREMFRFAFHIKAHRPTMRFVYLTSQSPEVVKRTARDSGLGDGDLIVLRADPTEIPRWLSLFRLGIFFLRPSYAAKGSSFTKLGEFLAAGVPVVTNTGVGDVDQILGDEHCGLLLTGLTEGDLSLFARKALALLDGSSVPERVRNNCRRCAEAHFSLEEGVRRYRSIYDALGCESLEAKTHPVAAEAR